MKDLSKEIRAYALKNAIDHDRAAPGSVLPKLFQHGLDRKDIQKVMPEITKIVAEVNKLSSAEREKEFDKLKSLVKEREEKEKTLPEIDVSGLKEVVTRLAPEPSKYNHLGHAMSFLLNYEYAKKYKGKCLLRFEDTNPEKVTQEYVDAMKEDVLDYLGIKVDGIRFVSDDMDLLYNQAEKLIEMDKAYMCFCDREKMQTLRHEGKECKCRSNLKKFNLQEWQHFIDGDKYTKGEAVLRIKGDMKSQNHVMRDSVLFRAIAAPHYRHGTKYKVWPMYDFYNPIEDSLMGVTLILRSNEFDLRVELQDYLKDLLDLKKQKIVQYGRFNVIDFTTKGREIRELVESGELVGWDDPRLITLKALKRRGIKREAFRELVDTVGLSKKQVNFDFDMIASINRKILDAKANRYFFVANPQKIIIKGVKIKEAKLPLHPSDPKAGHRVIKNIDEEFYVSDEIKKGRAYRLMHLLNFKDSKFLSTEVDPKLKAPMIHWLPVSKDLVRTKVFMPDGTWLEGLAEPDVKDLAVDTVVQFERFGFVRLDRKEKDHLEFWFSHR